MPFACRHLRGFGRSGRKKTVCQSVIPVTASLDEVAEQSAELGSDVGRSLKCKCGAKHQGEWSFMRLQSGVAGDWPSRQGVGVRFECSGCKSPNIGAPLPLRADGKRWGPNHVAVQCVLNRYPPVLDSLGAPRTTSGARPRRVPKTATWKAKAAAIVESVARAPNGKQSAAVTRSATSSTNVELEGYGSTKAENDETAVKTPLERCV